MDPSALPPHVSNQDYTPNSSQNSSVCSTPPITDDDVRISRKRSSDSINNNISQSPSKRKNKKSDPTPSQKRKECLQICNQLKDIFVWPECNQYLSEKEYGEEFSKGLWVLCTECDEKANNEVSSSHKEFLKKSALVKLNHPLNPSRARRHIERQHLDKFSNPKITGFFGGMLFHL